MIRSSAAFFYKEDRMQIGETVLSGAPHPGTELEVMETPAGFYIGFREKSGQPYSRETIYMTEGEANFIHGVIRGYN